jgi:hypothetical protein
MREYFKRGVAVNRKVIVKALKFHIREWRFEPSEVRGNFHNDIREYITYDDGGMIV